MTNSEAREAKPITSPNCAGYLRKWNLTTKTSCCTWPKKSEEARTVPLTDSHHVFRPGDPGIRVDRVTLVRPPYCIRARVSCSQSELEASGYPHHTRYLY